MIKRGFCSIALLALVLMSVSFATAQETQREKNRSVQPTVTGGTGLFTVYDASTLKKGEFNAGFFVNNFDRDPGDIDVTQGILNVGYGVTSKFEIFASTVFRQQVVSARPEELKGFFDPSGSIIILPQRSTPGGNTGLNFPILPGGYYNDFPLFGRSEVRTANTTVGGKYRFTDPNSRYGLALIGFANISSHRPDSAFVANYPVTNNGLIDGAGAGATDFGVILAPALRLGLATFTGNIGYVKTGDPKVSGTKIVDRRDELIASFGFDYAFNPRVQFVSEVASKVFVGGGTPNLNPVNPVDLTVGARFVPFGKNRKLFFSVGGAYRYMLTNSNDRRPDGFKGDYHGYVADIVLGLRKPEAPPDPCAGNVPPTISVSADKISVVEKKGDTVGLTATAKDPDARDASLNYSWSASSGSINGSGDKVTWSSGSSAPGDVTITCTVSDSCSHSTSASTTVKVEKGNTCPTVTVSADPTTIQEGSDSTFTFSANANDPDGQTLTYTWTASRGTLSGSGSTVTLSTAGLAAGPITVSVVVSDGICTGSDAANSSVTVMVRERPPVPQVFTTSCDATRFPKPAFKRNISRIDNQCKAELDRVADRLRGDPTATCVIDGHSEKGEQAGTAVKRAEKAKAYLLEKGIDGNRIEVRTFDDTRLDANGNCRIVIHVVPAGATKPE